jgi:polysaccharide biosynthesis/export protein
MNKVKLILIIILTTLFTNGCSRILEPVSLIATRNDDSIITQEEFLIEVKSLTFKKAVEANKDPYNRKIIIEGSGVQAKLVDEAVLLNSNIPKTFKKNEYLIGIGDILTFDVLNEFNNSNTIWPNDTNTKEYILGVGDELTLTQLIKTEDPAIQYKNENNKSFSSTDNVENLLKSEGIIGSDGNILLLEMGSFKASGRTLKEVRTEVRNILIRNGSIPNFQLEITGFNSKKAYLVKKTVEGGSTIKINNIPITLVEVALSGGLTGANKNNGQITLTRDKKKYRFTSDQLFNAFSPKVIIQDKDQIVIDIVEHVSERVTVKVASTGSILLSDIGSLYVKDKTLANVQKEINNIMLEKGLIPSFQLEINEYGSKKIYLNRQNDSSVIPIDNSKMTLKEILLSSNNPIVRDRISLITLKRDKKIYRLTGEQILNLNTPEIWMQDKDQVNIEYLSYKEGNVYTLSGVGNAKIVKIDPSRRETLADILFTEGGALNNTLAKRSEVYLLRGKNPSIAYHLNAQNVSRILVAAKTELRPNDIIYVAERPIISFSRLLSEFTPLRGLLRDYKDGNIP